MKGRIAWLCEEEDGTIDIKFEEPGRYSYVKITKVVIFEVED